MSELYHIKKKKDKGGFETEQPNPFKTDNGKTISSAMSSLKTFGKKVNNTVDRIESSSGYQKVKLAQKTKREDSKQNFASNTASSIKNIGSTVSNKATGFANAAKGAKNVANIFNDEDNEPKKLRKKLNATRLKEIVGPRNSRFNENSENKNTAENKRAQQYRYADWTPTVMPTSPGGKRQRKYKGR